MIQQLLHLIHQHQITAWVVNGRLYAENSYTQAGRGYRETIELPLVRRAVLAWLRSH